MGRRGVGMMVIKVSVIGRISKLLREHTLNVLTTEK
jgi:hypothetical protein